MTFGNQKHWNMIHIRELTSQLTFYIYIYLVAEWQR